MADGHRRPAREPVRSAHRRHLRFAWVLLLAATAGAQDLPPDEIQLNFSRYFDTFNVDIVYPNVAVTRKVADGTSLTARYLVDVVSAASIKPAPTLVAVANTVNTVDVVTSASGRRVRRVRATPTGDSTLVEVLPSGPDDVRHEFGAGLTQRLGGGLASLNGLFSIENDYSSGTLAGSFSRSLARNNTTISLGAVRSWDDVYPVTRDWRREKGVFTLSADVTQVLTPNLVAQVLLQHTGESGQLADVYEPVHVMQADTITVVDPVTPDTRSRWAAATRAKLRLSPASSLELGYRYYRDSWAVGSHSFTVGLQRHRSRTVIERLTLRRYQQSAASFFAPEFAASQSLMSSDVKLDRLSSDEAEVGLTIGGDPDSVWPFLTDERVQLDLSLDLYHRHTDSGYWYNDKHNLLAAYYNVGVRFRFP